MSSDSEKEGVVVDMREHVAYTEPLRGPVEYPQDIHDHRQPLGMPTLKRHVACVMEK